MTNLLVEPRCRARYALDEYRRERLLGLKRHLNELMFDQVRVGEVGEEEGGKLGGGGAGRCVCVWGGVLISDQTKP